MSEDPTYSLAFSSCPNDTFIFKAIARKRIDLKGYRFSLAMEDVETLNQNAVKKTYDISKLSFAALGKLLGSYGLLRSGAALGEGCGPLVISLPGRKLSDSRNPVVAVPGLGTTAYHLFEFFISAEFKKTKPRIVPMPFEKIMPAVIAKKADFGVIIHEGRFVYPSMGLELQADLGQWWETETRLPIPLGCIAVKRSIPDETARDVETLIRQSINHGFAHPDMDDDYIRIHAQEMEADVIRQHIELYVNEYSRQIGEKGEKAVSTFFEKAVQSGLMDASDMPLFAC